MTELRWTTKKTGLVLQYRDTDAATSENWKEWSDVFDVNGERPKIVVAPTQVVTDLPPYPESE